MKKEILEDYSGIFQFKDVKLDVTGREQEPNDICRAHHSLSMDWDAVLRLPHHWGSGLKQS